MRQFTHSAGGDTDFVGHAFNVPNRSTHHFPCLHRLIPSRLRGDRRVAGVLGDLLNGQAHFMDCSGDHVGHFLLATGAFGGVIHNPCDLADSSAQSFAGGQHFTDHVALAVEKAIEPTGQVAQFVGSTGI
ncbi:hypothetical protein D3C76_1110070 [compost metagenome]